MIHIAPVSEATVNPKVRAVFDDLKHLLGLKSVPQYFAFVANFPDLLETIWIGLRPIVDSPDFLPTIDNLVSLVKRELAREIPTNPEVELLSQKIGDEEKFSMEKEFQSLQKTNMTLIFLSMLVRETIKGLKLRHQETIKLEGGTLIESDQNSLTITGNTELGAFEDSALSTFFGNSTPLMVAYMKVVSDLMAEFQKSKDYLVIRVKLENFCQTEVKKVWPKFNFYYQQILSELTNKPYADELLYLMHDAFPAFFPKQLISSLLLELNLYPQAVLQNLSSGQIFNLPDSTIS